ncbi:uncharacterized protein N7496_007130 [Penicillium cataractarum]|uniref:Uncharacterized protein n=1 Tax=Penicillium cataractarum TaxID=2100454 RepID=A0A9W9S7I3_9EURO|nr:uncharacterized protein N7496_007130 [Penicillium cataractarum]KAJ5371038.1 hypothetical protein N7496_007130 [Penicillium cataractarum]
MCTSYQWFQVDDAADFGIQFDAAGIYLVGTPTDQFHVSFEELMRHNRTPRVWAHMESDTRSAKPNSTSSLAEFENVTRYASPAVDRQFWSGVV